MKRAPARATHATKHKHSRVAQPASAPEEAGSSEDEMTSMPAYRSLSTPSPPPVPTTALAMTPVAPVAIKMHPSLTPSFDALPARPDPDRVGAQSPVRLVTERDLLKRVLRKQFDQELDRSQQTPERWSRWIEERWAALSWEEKQKLTHERDQINTFARCHEARTASLAPQLCAPK